MSENSETISMNYDGDFVEILRDNTKTISMNSSIGGERWKVLKNLENISKS